MGPVTSGAHRISRVFGLSVPVVVVVLPMRIPFLAGVLVMTAVPIGVANPAPRMAVNTVLTIFRLGPTFVAIVVTSNTDTMIAVGVAALVSMTKGQC